MDDAHQPRRLSQCKSIPLPMACESNHGNQNAMKRRGDEGASTSFRGHFLQPVAINENCDSNNNHEALARPNNNNNNNNNKNMRDPPPAPVYRDFDMKKTIRTPNPRTMAICNALMKRQKILTKNKASNEAAAAAAAAAASQSFSARPTTLNQPTFEWHTIPTKDFQTWQ